MDKKEETKYGYVANNFSLLRQIYKNCAVGGMLNLLIHESRSGLVDVTLANKDIKERTGYGDSVITRALDSLEELGIISRRSSGMNERGRRVITVHYEKLYERGTAAFESVYCAKQKQKLTESKRGTAQTAPAQPPREIDYGNGGYSPEDGTYLFERESSEALDDVMATEYTKKRKAREASALYAQTQEPKPKKLYEGYDGFYDYVVHCDYLPVEAKYLAGIGGIFFIPDEQKQAFVKENSEYRLKQKRKPKEGYPKEDIDKAVKAATEWFDAIRNEYLRYTQDF